MDQLMPDYSYPVTVFRQIGHNLLSLTAHLSHLGPSTYSYAYSYGSDWGTYGYVQMLRNAKHCGITMDAVFPVV